MMYVPLDGTLYVICALVPPPLLLSCATTVPLEFIRYTYGSNALELIWMVICCPAVPVND